MLNNNGSQIPQNYASAPMQQQLGHDDRPLAQHPNIPEEEKWRLQEEQWLKAEEARYGRQASADMNPGLPQQQRLDDGTFPSASETEMPAPFPSPMSNNTSLRTHPNNNNNFNAMGDDGLPMDGERFGKLRNYYDAGAQSANIQQQFHQPPQQFSQQQQLPLAYQQLPQQFNQQQQLPLTGEVPLSHHHHQERRVQPMPTSPDTLNSANLQAGDDMGYYNNKVGHKPSLAASTNASTKSLVKEDGVAPYSNLNTTVANTINSNHNYDAQTMADHDAIMQVEGQRYNAAAEIAGIPTRINDSEENKQLGADGASLASPTAFLDDAIILEEKAKQQQLEKRIDDKNSQYNRLHDDGAKDELLVGPAAIGGQNAAGPNQQQLQDADGPFMREPFDDKASGDNFVAMDKPRASKLNAERQQQRAFNQQQRQAAGILPAAQPAADHKDHNKGIGAVKAHLIGHKATSADEAVPLGAQTYDGMPPKPIQRILDDTPDRWFEQYRRETSERRAQKETQRRIELSRKEKEADGGLTTKISAVFDDTKASLKRSKQEHDLKAEDKKMANFHHRAQERMTKYFPLHVSERFTCAFDAQALHHHLPLSGHLILTDKTLCFLGKGQEEVTEAVPDKRPSDMAAATHPSTHKEHVLVKEAIPLINIASIVMGAVVKNNGKVFIMDGSDEIVVADALQLFLKDGRVVQLRSFSHPCVTKKGMSYDGRTVSSLHRFLNFLDHNWRAAGGDSGLSHQQQQLTRNDIPARE